MRCAVLCLNATNQSILKDLSFTSSKLINTKLKMFFSREAHTNSSFMSAVPAQLQSALLHFIGAELIILTSGACTAGQEASMISKSTRPVPF